MAEENQTTHKRRVRYSGKYPKKNIKNFSRKNIKIRLSM